MIELLNGDCLELMQKIPEKSIDMILTDPPYGTTACKWDSVIPFEPMWKQLKRIIKDNGATLLFGSEPFSSALRISNIKNYRYDWIWDKKSAGNFLNAKFQPLKTFENISVFCKCGGGVYFPILTETSENRAFEKPQAKKSDFVGDLKSGFFQMTEKNKKGNQRFPKAIIELSKQTTECCNSKCLHPTQKPVALLEYLIKTYTKENETVLDFTMGSGSTGVACKNLNRNFIGIELDEKYFNIAEERIKNIDIFSIDN